jgi:hypothetical protein
VIFAATQRHEDSMTVLMIGGNRKMTTNGQGAAAWILSDCRPASASLHRIKTALTVLPTGMATLFV